MLKVWSKMLAKKIVILSGSVCLAECKTVYVKITINFLRKNFKILNYYIILTKKDLC